MSGMAMTNKERQEAYRARKAMEGATEVRGIYLPLELHQALKDYARKLAAPKRKPKSPPAE